MFALLLPLATTLALAAVKQSIDIPTPSLGDEVGYFVWQQTWIADLDPDPTDELTGWGTTQFPRSLDRGGRPVTINKFPTGWSQAILPFTATAQLMLWIDNNRFGGSHRLDGSDPLIVRAAWLGATCWSILGMLACLGVARYYTAPLPAAAALAACWVGTAAFAYTWKLPVYAHGVAGAMLAIAAWLAIVRLDAQRLTKGGGAWAVLLGVAMGLLLVTRPVNLILAAPVGAVVLLRMRRAWPGHQRAVVTASLLLALGALPPLAIELLTRKVLYGSFLFDGYREAGESFALSLTNVLKVMFFFTPDTGFGRGLFVVHPLVLLCLIGLLMQARGSSERRWLAAGSVLAIGGMILIYGCWWCWSLNYSYGARWSTDLLPLLTVGLAWWLHQTNRPKRLIVCIILCSAWSLLACL